MKFLLLLVFLTSELLFAQKIYRQNKVYLTKEAGIRYEATSRPVVAFQKTMLGFNSPLFFDLSLVNDPELGAALFYFPFKFTGPQGPRGVTGWAKSRVKNLYWGPNIAGESCDEACGANPCKGGSCPPGYNFETHRSLAPVCEFAIQTKPKEGGAYFEICSNKGKNQVCYCSAGFDKSSKSSRGPLETKSLGEGRAIKVDKIRGKRPGKDVVLYVDQAKASGERDYKELLRVKAGTGEVFLGEVKILDKDSKFTESEFKRILPQALNKKGPPGPPGPEGVVLGRGSLDISYRMAFFSNETCDRECSPGRCLVAYEGKKKRKCNEKRDNRKDWGCGCIGH